MKEENNAIKREHEDKVHQIQQAHKERVTNIRSRHATAMARTKETLRKSEELVQGFNEMFANCLSELRDETVPKEKAEQLSRKAATAHTKYLEYKSCYLILWQMK